MNHDLSVLVYLWSKVKMYVFLPLVISFPALFSRTPPYNLIKAPDVSLCISLGLLFFNRL